MTDSPEAVVRRHLAPVRPAASRRSESGFRELLDPAVEWVNPPEAIEGGVRTGFDGWMTAVGNMRTGLGTGATYDLDSVAVRGEHVMVGGFMQTGGTSSGAEAGMRTYAVCGWSTAASCASSGSSSSSRPRSSSKPSPVPAERDHPCQTLTHAGAVQARRP